MSDDRAFLGTGSPRGLNRLLLLVDLAGERRTHLAALRDELFDASWVRDPIPYASLSPEVGAEQLAEQLYLLGGPGGASEVFERIVSIRTERRARGLYYESIVLQLGVLPARGSGVRATDLVVAGHVGEWLVRSCDDRATWLRLDALSRTWRGSLGELVATERAIAEPAIPAGSVA